MSSSSENRKQGGADGRPAGEERASEICLVNMPPASVTRPSIALGLLKAILERDGLATTVVYPNLWYLEFVGSGLLEHPPPPEACFVDWLFSSAAFPAHEAWADPFLDMLLRAHPDVVADVPGEPREILLEMRARSVEFVDLTARRILQAHPRIVGCTSTFEQHIASLAVLRRIRELAPDVVTMLGGANCETTMGKTTHERFEWVDLVVSGEADAIIAPLCRRVLEHGADLPRDQVPHNVFAPIHRREGYPRVEGGDGLPRGTTTNLAGLPVPDYDDYFFRELPAFRYRDHVRAGIPYESSRGCWWGERSHCTFCGLNGGGMGYRSKTPQQVIQEIDHLVDRYQCPRLSAVDNIIDMTYFDSVLPHLAAREPKLNLCYETKANLKRAQIEAFRRAGVYWIQPGIESLHTEVLRLIGKGVKSYQNVQTLKWCREFGLVAFWNLIVGFPGERDEWYGEVAAWLPLIEHLQPASMVSVRYDRYSPYFMRSEEYGLDLGPCPPYQMIYPLPPEALRDQAYFFTDQKRTFAAQLDAEERPGLLAVAKRLVAWKAARLPRLEWDHDQDGDVVLDSRACATAERHPLTTPHRLVLHACDSAVPLATVHAAVARAGCGDQELVDAVVEDLRERKLLIELDGRLLGLVLDRPADYRPKGDFGGGSFLWNAPPPDAVSQEDSAEPAVSTSAEASV